MINEDATSAGAGNPYAPPTARLDEPTAVAGSDVHDGPLHTSRQVLWATLFGSVFAGCWLIARNLRVMGEIEESRKVFWLGVLGSSAWFICAMVLPDWVPMNVMGIALAIGLGKAATVMMGDAITRHLDAGGPKRSSWGVAGLSLFSFALHASPLLLIYVFFPDMADPFGM